MKRLKIDHLLTYDPITDNQEEAYSAWDDGDHLVLCGSAGTGKSFIALYLSLQDTMDKSYAQDKVVIVRSVVPTREMGYLPEIQSKKRQIPTLHHIVPYVRNSSMRRVHMICLKHRV